MTTNSDLNETIKATIEPSFVGINSDGVYDQTGLTQQQIDDIDALFTAWDAQTPAEKLQPETFTQTKVFVLAIRDALNAITDPSAVTLNNDYVIYDTDGTTPLLTIPSDATWATYTNANIKTFIREMTLTYARILEYAVEQKRGYIKIKKYIKSELSNGS